MAMYPICVHGLQAFFHVQINEYQYRLAFVLFVFMALASIAWVCLDGPDNQCFIKGDSEL